MRLFASAEPLGAGCAPDAFAEDMLVEVEGVGVGEARGEAFESLRWLKMKVVMRWVSFYPKGIIGYREVVG